MKKSKKGKVITPKILNKEERQKLYEEAQLHFKDERDVIEWELDYPSEELCDAIVKMAELGKTIDFSKFPTEVGKL